MSKEEFVIKVTCHLKDSKSGLCLRCQCHLLYILACDVEPGKCPKK